MKYIIELDPIPNTGLFKARGANTLVFDGKGIENILKPYKEEPEIDWSQVKADTPILVRNNGDRAWYKMYFARYQDGKVRAWNNGNTSWTGTCTTAWDFAKLAEGGKQYD